MMTPTVKSLLREFNECFCASIWLDLKHTTVPNIHSELLTNYTCCIAFVWMFDLD